MSWLVRQWDQVEEIIRTRGDGLWLYVIHEHRVVEAEIPKP